MAQVKIGDPHGLYRIMVGRIDTTGYNYGTAGPDISNGTLVTPYLVRYAKAAEMQNQDRTVIDFTGGDIWTGAYVYGVTTLGTFEMQLSTVEADLIALTSGSLVDQTTNSRWTIYSENIMRPTPPQCFIITSFRLQSKQIGQKGADKYIHRINPRVWIAPKGITGAPNFQAPGTYVFTVIPTVGERMPWGPAFGTNQDYEENETPVFYIITDNPIHIVGYKTSGTTANINLPYKPVTGDYTTPNSSTQAIQVAVNGTITNAASINTTTGVVQMTGLTAGDYVGILYETNYEAY